MHVAACRCGRVRFSAVGKPIAGAVCHCDDCQAGARQIEALPDAPPVHDAGGGTPYLLYRKDRFRCLEGGEALKDLRLRDKSPTRRVVATCCNSGMFLDFEKAHWVSVYVARFAAPPGPIEMRIQTRFQPQGATIPTDLPVHRAFSPKLVARLLWARIAMLLRR